MGDFDRNFDRRRSGRDRSDRGRSGTFGGRDRGRDRGGGGRGRDRDRGRDGHSERHEMHSAICDKCGKDCEVPFKPTQGKPIYCSDCFKDKSREAGSRSEFGKQSNGNFDQINKKLDRILKILEKQGMGREKPKEKKGKPAIAEEKTHEKEEKPAVEEEKPKKKPVKVQQKEKPKKKK